MSIKLIRALALWAATLSSLVVALLPFSVWGRMAIAFGLAVLIVPLWFFAERRSRDRLVLSTFADLKALPGPARLDPVVLVVGAGQDRLFAMQAEHSTLRMTEQGCYLRVPDVEQLRETVANLFALWPHWHGQISVMFVVNPQEHSDKAVLAGQIRSLCHQLAMIRRQGTEPGLLLVSFLQMDLDEPGWFIWESGQTLPHVSVANKLASLAHWQGQVESRTVREERLQALVQLNSLVSWLNEFVFLHLGKHGRSHAEVPLACAVKVVAGPPSGRVDGNLWQRWLCGKTGLVAAEQSTSGTGVGLPFPDVLLPLLPRPAASGANVIAIWMFTTAAAIALLNAGWQNTLLLRQVSDDLRRYAAAQAIPARHENRLAQQEAALMVLRHDAQRLDEHYRQGTPLALGWGLYRAEQLRGLLWKAIASFQLPVAQVPQAAGRQVRLNSLSLFDIGSAQLRADATRVMIDALVDIRARSGWLIVITGHTDASGSGAHNMQLSQARAEAVRDWMQRMGGIPDGCFAVSGAGASQPIASNDTEHGRTANRRVDIRLVPAEGACTPFTTAPDRKPLSHSATSED